jgi:translation elongation factor EF-Ts
MNPEYISKEDIPEEVLNKMRQEYLEELKNS